MVEQRDAMRMSAVRGQQPVAISAAPALMFSCPYQAVVLHALGLQTDRAVLPATPSFSELRRRLRILQPLRYVISTL